jgi:hypothetical protein
VGPRSEDRSGQPQEVKEQSQRRSKHVRG